MEIEITDMVIRDTVVMVTGLADITADIETGFKLYVFTL